MVQPYKKIYWTSHVAVKMRQYGLSKSKVLQVLYKPERKEKGIAPGTTAAMQTKKIYSKPRAVFDNKKTIKIPGEIWMMYTDTKAMRTIISAWRYPGISKPGDSIPIPDDIRQELFNNI